MRAGVRGMGRKQLEQFIKTCEAVRNNPASHDKVRELAAERLLIARGELEHRTRTKEVRLRDA